MSGSPSDSSTDESEQFGIKKSGVEEAQLATAFWADLLSMASRRMDRLDGETYEIEVEVTIRDES